MWPTFTIVLIVPYTYMQMYIQTYIHIYVCIHTWDTCIAYHCSQVSGISRQEGSIVSSYWPFHSHSGTERDTRTYSCLWTRCRPAESSRSCLLKCPETWWDTTTPWEGNKHRLRRRGLERGERWRAKESVSRAVLLLSSDRRFDHAALHLKLPWALHTHTHAISPNIRCRSSSHTLRTTNKQLKQDAKDNMFTVSCLSNGSNISIVL